MRIAVTCIPMIGLLLLCCECKKKQVQSTPPLSPQIIARSRVSDGDLARLDRIFLKAKHGKPITLGFIGGSITAGQRATQPKCAYANLVADWWRGNFPETKFTVVNAGVPGTGSSLGCLRVDHDLLAAHPDFVIVEFSVNDRGDRAHADTFEGVVRKIMADPDQPAMILLYTMHHDGTNAQEFQAEVGRRYQLPMISFRDALWPEMTAGRMKWADMIADSIHPNDRGHAAIADFINALLQDALDGLPAAPGAVPALPPPRYSDVFATTQWIHADELKPVTNDGWEFDPAHHCWKSSAPGSTIEFTMIGRLIDLLYARVSPAAGTVRVSIDDGPAMLCDAWFDGTWEGYIQPDTIGRDLSPGPHRVRIELLSDRNLLSIGHEFRILGLASAGN